MSDAADYWDAAAAEFDEVADHGLHDPSVRGAWASLLLPLLPTAPARIADLGCGTGSLSVLLAGHGHAVSGVDLSPRMVERARTKAEEAELDVEFLVGDAQEPPWPAHSFDVALARHVLWTFDDPGTALDSWIRILRPNGRLILIEGRWSTGAGIAARDVVDLLGARGRPASLTQLADPLLWGAAVSDERYVVVSPPVDGARG